MALSEQDLLDAADAIRGRQEATFASGPALDVNQDPLMADAEGMRRQQDGMFGAPSPLSHEVQQQAVDNLRGTPRKLDTLDRMGSESAPVDGQRGPLLGFSVGSGLEMGDPGLLKKQGPADVMAAPGSALERSLPPERVAAINNEDKDARTGLSVAAMNSATRKADAAKSGGAPASEASEAPRGAPAMGDTGGLPPQFSPVVSHAGGFRQDLAGVTKGTMDARTKNAEGLAEDDRAHGMTQAVNARLDAANYMKEAERADTEAAHIQQRRIERANFVQGKLDERETLSKEMSETNLDGSKFWKNPGSIVMAIGAALLGRGEDLDKAIAQDLNMQKDAYARKDKRLGDLDTYVSKTREVNGDKDAADVQAEISARESAITRIKAMAQNSGSQELIEKGEMAAKKQQDAVDALKSTYEQMMHYKPFTTGGGMAATKPQDSERYVPALGGNAPTKEEAIRARKLTAALQEYDKHANELLALREKTENFASPDQVAAMNFRSGRMALLQKDINELGQVTGADISLMPLAPDAGSAWTPGTSAKIRESLKQTAYSRTALKQNLGIVEANRQIAPNAKGEMAVQDRLTGGIARPTKPVERKPVQ